MVCVYIFWIFYSISHTNDKLHHSQQEPDSLPLVPRLSLGIRMWRLRLLVTTTATSSHIQNKYTLHEFT